MNIKNLINKIGLFALPVLGGWLGAFGGADGTSKIWRRILIPGLLTSYAFSNTHSVLVITIMSMAGALSIGYGIPSETDSGSTLGRFWYKIFKGNHLLADLATRGTIAKLIALSLISIPIIKGNWIIYGLGLIGIILTNSLLSWRNLGTYKLFRKELSWSETLTWGLITLCGIIIIFFGGK